jgi:hypothetical protein
MNENDHDKQLQETQKKKKVQRKKIQPTKMKLNLQRDKKMQHIYEKIFGRVGKRAFRKQ